MDNILLTCYYADGWTGSFLHILELAEYFKSKKYNVYIGAIRIDSNIQKNIQNKGISLLNISDIDIDIVYDIVWFVHHPTVNILIEKGLKYKKILFNCLSSFHNLELPASIFDNQGYIVCNSEETANRLYKLKYINLLTLHNLIPDEFINKELISNSLKKITVISNKPCKEIDEVTNILQNKHGIQIEKYGFIYNNYKRITPEIIKNTDLVITIGKTVQYCLGMSVPVFIYGPHGGNGYIDNIYKELYYNCSGRPDSRKTAYELENLIIKGYENNLKNIKIYNEYVLEFQNLNKNVNEILNYIPNKQLIINKDRNYYKEIINSEYILNLEWLNAQNRKI